MRSENINIKLSLLSRNKWEKQGGRLKIVNMSHKINLKSNFPKLDLYRDFLEFFSSVNQQRQSF